MTVAVLLAAQLTRLPQLLEAPPAAYPPERLARGETADVACSVDIDEHGAVTQVVVEQPVAPDFDAAAVEAIRRFRFSPAEIDGQPAAVRIRYVYHFVVEQERVEQPRGARGTVKGTVVEAGTRRPIAGAEAVDDTGAQAVADAGVDLDDVFRVLEEEAVQKFVDAWDELTDSVRSELEDKK